MKKLWLYCLLSLPFLFSEMAEGQEKRLSLADAIERARKKHPAIELAKQNIAIAKSGKIEAELRPNPELEVELEDIGNTDGGDLFDGTTASMRLSQTFELGGKRRLRSSVADQGILLAEQEKRLAEINLLTEVAEAFLSASIAQEKEKLATKTLQLANELRGSVDELVEAGKASPLEKTRAALATEQSRSQFLKAEKRRQNAFCNLAALWGGEVDFATLASDFFQLEELPSRESALQALDNHPEILLAQKEINLRRSELALAESLGTSDLNLTFGISHNDAEKDTTFSIATALSLPIFDRAQGKTAEAKGRIALANAEFRATRRRLEIEVKSTWAQLGENRAQAERLRAKIIPAAEANFAAVNKGYKAGKFAYLDVLQARETLFKLQAEHLEALSAYHESRIALNQLTLNH